MTINLTFRCAAWVALSSLMGLVSVMREARAIDIPPVQWQGKAEAQYRLNQPDNGKKTTGQMYTGEITGSSYLWQPWFGNWRARLAFSKLYTYSERDSDGSIFSGDGRVNLFHKSRFPVEMFFNIQDNRVDFEDSDLATDTRFTQFGVNHRYTSLGGNKSYQALVLRDVQEDFTLDSKDQANRLLLNGQMRKGLHSFNSSGFLNDRKSNIENFNQLDGQLNLNHSWRPNAQFSIDSSGSVGFLDAESDTSDAQGHNARLSSQVLWSDATRPLVARGEVIAGSQHLSGSRIEDREIDELRLNGTLTYILRPRLRLGLGARGRVLFGDRDEHSTSQDLTLDYLSEAYPVKGFSYTWNANGAIKNEIFSEEASRQVYLSGIGHDLNRVWRLNLGVPVSLSFNTGQRISGEEDTSLGSLVRLENRASINLNANYAGASSFLQLLGSDTREWGRRENEFALVTLSGVHNQWLSPYSSFSAAYNLNWSFQSRSDLDLDEDGDLNFCVDDDLVSGDLRCSDDTVERKFKSSSLELTYRHGRAFQVQRLSFESRLRASSQSFSLADYDDDGGEVVWDNRLYYSIGKLDLRLRGVAVHREADDSGNKLLLFSVTRRF